MHILRAVFSFAVLAFAIHAFGQAGEGPRGSTPPGASQDGAAPGDGALRDQCLLQERGASTGGTTEIVPKPADPSVRDPVSAPPPQNPR